MNPPTPIDINQFDIDLLTKREIILLDSEIKNYNEYLHNTSQTITSLSDYNELVNNGPKPEPYDVYLSRVYSRVYTFHTYIEYSGLFPIQNLIWKKEA